MTDPIEEYMQTICTSAYIKERNANEVIGVLHYTPKFNAVVLRNEVLNREYMYGLTYTKSFDCSQLVGLTFNACRAKLEEAEKLGYQQHLKTKCLKAPVSHGSSVTSGLIYG